MSKFEWSPSIPEIYQVIHGFRKDPLKELTNIQETYGDRAFFNTPIRNLVILSDPHDASTILQQDTINVDKMTFDQKIIQAVAGESVLTLPGTPRWREQRDLAQPSFAHSMLQNYAPVITRHTEDMFEEWEQIPRNPDGTFEIPDVQSEFMYLTLKIISDALFHHTITTDEAVKLNETLKNVSEYFSHNVRRMGIPWRLRTLPLPSNKRFFEDINYLFQFADRVLEERSHVTSPPHDLLSMLTVETDQPLSHDELRDNILAFLIAGHATTTAALSWTLVNLSKSENEQDKHDLQGAVDTQGEHSPYPKWCFEESMRLYPPAWIITRKATHDMSLDDMTIIPRNAYILTVPYLIQRHPTYWEHPDDFIPERFDRTRARPGVTFSFGKGPRGCVGRPLAMLEGPQILAMLAKQYDFSVVDADQTKPAWNAILRPDGDVRMMLRPR